MSAPVGILPGGAGGYRRVGHSKDMWLTSASRTRIPAATRKSVFFPPKCGGSDMSVVVLGLSSGVLIRCFCEAVDLYCKWIVLGAFVGEVCWYVLCTGEGMGSVVFLPRA